MLCRQGHIKWHDHTFKPRLRSLQVSHSFVNPYKVLQVSEDADPKQIKRAYRKLALRHHPDISEEPSAEQDFLRIQEAYEVLTNKRDAAQAGPKNNGWDFHDWYWDFTMSRRWDSHWKKTGKSGPSPFAATPTHREQWLAQLGGLKQKAAFRRTQQQAQQADEQWTQQQQQHGPQPSHGVQGSHQAAQHQHPDHEHCHATNIFHGQHGDAMQDQDLGADDASVGSRGWCSGQVIVDFPVPEGHSGHQQQHAQPASAFVEMTHELLCQVQSCHTRLAHSVSLCTSQWSDQASDLLRSSLKQLRSDSAIRQVNCPDGEMHSQPADQVQSASASFAQSGSQTPTAAGVKSDAPHHKSTTAERSAMANLLDEHLHSPSDDSKDRSAEHSADSQAAFQTPHAQVQSQLTGLRRRAARKQDT